MINLIDVSTSARSYISYVLCEGYTLLRKVSHFHDTCKGTIHAIIPQGFVLDRTKDFIYGQGMTAKDVDVYLSDWIVSTLRNHIDAICVIQDYIHKPDEKALSRFSTNIGCFNSEVYHIITRTHDRADIANAIRFVHDLPFFAGIVSTPSGYNNLGAQVMMDDDMMNDIARNASSVFFGAFDGESYLIWDILTQCVQ